MAKKLKNLSITSTDLVDAGANPDAHIRLFKSAQKFVGGLKKSTEAECPRRGFPVIVKSLEKSADGSLEELNLDDLPELLLQDEPKTETELLEEEESYMKMKFVKNGIAVTDEDLKIMEGLAKRYNLVLEEAETVEFAEAVEVVEKSTVQVKVEKSAEELAELENITKMKQELEDVKKSLALKELEEEASKYEILGKKKGELAEAFYKMKAMGEDMLSVYKQSLDEHLALVEKSGMFVEKGSSFTGDSSSTPFDTKVGEIMKRDGISVPEAVVKAYEENPEMASEYEKSYVGKEV